MFNDNNYGYRLVILLNFCLILLRAKKKLNHSLYANQKQNKNLIKSFDQERTAESVSFLV